MKNIKFNRTYDDGMSFEISDDSYQEMISIKRNSNSFGIGIPIDKLMAERLITILKAYTESERNL